jgi:crotonobetainyl-CoA:carnitine CoA-transferase CaiB-like acyl-CoA transferase
MAGVLEGIKVLSMGQVVAVPAASSELADWGAEVIKLEPLFGDQTRGQVRLLGTSTGQINWPIQVLNRGSKGLAVDLKQEDGRKIIYKLIEECDVFLSNYERGTVNKFGLDYASLSKINPGLVYATLSGYGRVGPDKDERGYDYSAGWARSGMMYLIGEPGASPTSPRAGMIDSMAGSHMVSAVLAALVHRGKTGKGQEIEVSLYHAAVWTLCMDVQMAVAGGDPQKSTRKKAGNPLWNSYPTSDNRWFWLAMLQPDPCWPGFCRSIGKPELIDDPKFNSMQQRTKNNEELIRIIETVISTKTMAEWESKFREYNVIYGRVQSPREVTTDPQALANHFFAEVDYPGMGKMKLVTTPVDFYQNPAAIQGPAPEIGQHTEEILLELGYNWEDIGQLKEKKVIR